MEVSACMEVAYSHVPCVKSLGGALRASSACPCMKTSTRAHEAQCFIVASKGCHSVYHCTASCTENKCTVLTWQIARLHHFHRQHRHLHRIPGTCGGTCRQASSSYASRNLCESGMRGVVCAKKVSGMPRLLAHLNCCQNTLTLMKIAMVEATTANTYAMTQGVTRSEIASCKDLLWYYYMHSAAWNQFWHAVFLGSAWSTFLTRNSLLFCFRLSNSPPKKRSPTAFHLQT